MPAGHRLGPDAIETIKSMTIHGGTQRAIAREVGCEASTVAYHQKKLGLKASNKWKFGGTAEKYPTIKEDDRKDTVKVQEQPKEHFISVSQKTVRFTGARTGFEYEAGTNINCVKILTGYNENEETIGFEIDIKDLVAFGNEILDVAEYISKM